MTEPKGNPMTDTTNHNPAFATRRENGTEQAATDATERAASFNELKAERDRDLAAIRTSEVFTEDAKAQMLRDAEVKWTPRLSEESERVMGSLDDEIEKAYKAAHGSPGKQGRSYATDHAEETARELRLARIREEVRDDLEGGMDPLRAYQEAVRLGDKERMDVIGRMGPRYLTDTTRRRLAQLVEENLPEGRRKAREKLRRLEAEKRHLEIGFALRGLGRR